MNKTKNTDYTVVKNEFPAGWSESPFELLLKRLEENGFSIFIKYVYTAVTVICHINAFQIILGNIKRSYYLAQTSSFRSDIAVKMSFFIQQGKTVSGIFAY